MSILVLLGKSSDRKFEKPISKYEHNDQMQLVYALSKKQALGQTRILRVLITTLYASRPSIERCVIVPINYIHLHAI